MFRIMMISDLKRFNDKSENFEDSIDVLKNFLLDESSEAFLEGEEHPFWRKGDFIKRNSHLVDSLDKAKIEVYSNEHPPAHFHFNVWEFKSSYEIRTCSKLEWNVPRKYENKLILWFKNWGKEKLIQKWNATRPEDCPVGKLW